MCQVSYLNSKTFTALRMPQHDTKLTDKLVTYKDMSFGEVTFVLCPLQSHYASMFFMQ